VATQLEETIIDNARRMPRLLCVQYLKENLDKDGDVWKRYEKGHHSTAGFQWYVEILINGLKKI
jgi:hypothetical protein